MKNIPAIRRCKIAILLTVFFTVNSFATVAGTNKITGDLFIVGLSNQKPLVKVNGEAAATGRSLFSTSVIETNENSEAIINIGNLGKFELAANSKIIISFDENHINGDLTAGSLLVLNARENINIKLPEGKTVSSKTGDKVSVNQTNLPATPSPAGISSLIPWIVVIGAAITSLVVSPAIGNNNSQASGGTTVVSPSS
jgi:hypothetical protein